MKKLRNTTDNGTQRLGKIALRSFLFVVLAVFFLWKLPSTAGLAHGTSQGSRLAGLHTALLGTTGDFYRTPLNHPKGNGPIWTGNIAELESEDDVQMGDFGFVCLAAYFIVSLHQRSLEQGLSALPPPYLENRPTVPLFILFHSWKNFIH